MKSKKGKARSESRFQTEEVGRDAFSAISVRQSKGEIRWYALEAGTHFAATHTWLWRVSYEVLALRPKVETQQTLI
jgi:hypothetical protein